MKEKINISKLFLYFIYGFIFPIIIGVLSGIGSYFIMKYQDMGLFARGYSYVVGCLITALIMFYYKQKIEGKK